MSFRVTHSPSIRTNLGQPRATQNAVPLGGGTGLSMGSVFEILLQFSFVIIPVVYKYLGYICMDFI